MNPIVKKSRTKKYTRTIQSLAVVGVMILPLVLFAPPTSASHVTDQCEIPMKKGGHFKKEDHKGSCTFSCNEGDFVTVEVINNKGRGRVSIVADCEGARAECSKKVRSCPETIGSFIAQRSGTGECRAKVNHIQEVDKIFRCQAKASHGDWEDPPRYGLCVVHWISEWLLGEPPEPSLVEVCYYEGNVVCVEVPLTIHLEEPIPWVYSCLPWDDPASDVNWLVCSVLDELMPPPPPWCWEMQVAEVH